MGDTGTATIRVLSANGNALPNQELALDASGARDPDRDPHQCERRRHDQLHGDERGDDVGLTVRARGLASTLPRIFTPSVPVAARNGQRLLVPDSQELTAPRGANVNKARVNVSSVAAPAELLAGTESRDRVTIRGAGANFRVTVTARLHGPLRTAGSIRCDQPPAWEGTWRTDGPGEYQTPPVKLEKAGWYVYVQTVPGDADHVGVSTPCTDPRSASRSSSSRAYVPSSATSARRPARRSRTR